MMIKESTLAAVAVSVVCDRCGQTCPSDDGHPQHAVLSAAWKSGLNRPWFRRHLQAS